MVMIAQKDRQSSLEAGPFSEMDLHFAGLMKRLAFKDEPAVFFAAAMASRATSEGHVCLDLSSLDDEPLFQDLLQDSFVPPALSTWRKILLASGVVGKPGEFKPLILDGNSRLYLHRYWHYEMTLAEDIVKRASSEMEDVDPEILKKGLERIFPRRENEGVNWQKMAAFMALTKQFCVISGGPGTGKTSVISWIASLLLEQPGGTKNRMAFVAPTGKAASRMKEALKKIAPALPSEGSSSTPVFGSSTIHRLLGTIKNSPYFRHNRQNPLPYDTIFVDEVSMVDLPLLSKLLWAAPPHARVILMGDKDQLSSVAPGSVLGDICNKGFERRFSRRTVEKYSRLTGDEINMAWDPDPEPVIKDAIVELTKSYRFGAQSGIGHVSRAVNAGDGEKALEILRKKTFPDTEWRDLPTPGALPRALRRLVTDFYGTGLQTDDPMEALSLFERFRILSALRQGPYGVAEINRICESILAEKGLINLEKTWYRGRPVLVTHNDDNLGLYNGDVGVILNDVTGDNALRAFFPARKGSARKISPARLPEHETVYAMTVHKSQGSEFDNCVFILPDRMSPVITGELIYTGITRARKSIQVWGTDGVFMEGVKRRIRRHSGLREALWC